MKKTSPAKNICDDPTTSQNNDKVKGAGQALLDWYDRHRRVLPWRALPGQKADPYHVWLSEIMLQQTVVKAATPYFLKFVENWPTVHDLAKAPQEEIMNAWAGLGYYARARNLHKCAKIISKDYNGSFPDNQPMLEKLPGIGAYTSAAMTAIAFNKPATVVDGNVERVMARLYAVRTPLPDSKKQLKEYTKEFADRFADRPGDLAQAMMDLGAGICIPKAPRCVLCPIQDHCEARKINIAEDLPYKKAGKTKPEKHGYIYFIKDSKENILLHKRPEQGLLGGMTGFPTSEWVTKDKERKHPDFIENLQKNSNYSIQKMKNTIVFHSFTHFNLELSSYFLEIKDMDSPLTQKTDLYWLPYNSVKKDIFPTVFRKFYQFIHKL